MTRTPTTDSKASWAIEVERDAPDPPEYYAITVMILNDKGIKFRTIEGNEIAMSRDHVAKILIMRTLPQ